jgi:hypothetical protein
MFMVFAISLSFVFVGLTDTTRAVQTHPFLLVRESDYPALQAQASSEPWLTMKTRAINDVTNLNYDPLLDITAKSNRMRDIVSAGSLAYILDPVNKDTYKNKVLSTLNNWDDIAPALSCANWSNTVPPGIAFFNSVLSLDVIYNDLTPEELAGVESKLRAVSDWYWANNCSWEHNQYAVRGIWAIYEGDRVKIDSAKADYVNAVLNYLTVDGVYNGGPSYAWARFGAAEDSKSYFMDVLEFTGENTSIYSNSQIKGMYEWLYGGSITPFKQRVTFGDTQPEFYPGTSGYDHPATYRADRFSDLAAQNASWLDSVPNPGGRLLDYLFMDEPMAAPQKPLSKIWPSGMASFWENNSVSGSLGAALWNPQVSEGHSHKDVNAVHLSAYGESILRNSGYAGWGNGCLGFSWTYVHDNAVSNSTVLIDNVDHSLKHGSGIVEGFTNSSLDYASGDSGSALSNGKNLRNLLMVHPQDGLNGYFILVDEITANSNSSKANIILHPSSAVSSVTTNLTEYRWLINQYSGHDVYADVFLGTVPFSATLNDGALCTNTFSYNSILGKYLNATYSTNNGKKNIVTVVFPSDSTHAKATMSRITGTKYSGAKVDIGTNTSDIVLESSSDKSISYQGVSFKGITTFYRLNSGTASTYFVKKGTSFDNGKTAKKGFTSVANVSVQLKEKTGSIVSPGTDVTFYYPGITSVSLNGNVLPNISSGSGWVKVNIASGTHKLDLATP